MSTLVELIPPPIRAMNHDNNHNQRLETTMWPGDGVLVLIGCGTSELPEYILDHPSNPWRQLVLVDSSRTCMQLLQDRYQPRYTNHELVYLCGDVTRLAQLLEDSHHAQEDGDDDNDANTPPVLVDCVYDKGLLDALLCGEGWDTGVLRLLYQVSRVLHPGGSYLIVSYPLPESTQAFLMHQGQSVGLTNWTFERFEGEYDKDVTSKIQPNSRKRPVVQVSRCIKSSIVV